MYNSNTDSLGLILGVEVFFSLGHCSGALCKISTKVCKMEPGRFQNVATTLVGLSLVAVKCRNIEIERG